MNTMRKRARPATSERNAATRELLVVKALELFAEKGLVGVSLRAVGEAAGQRNTAAVHHHFGDREALLEAALDRVLAAVREPVDHAEARALGLQIGEPATPLHAATGYAFLPVLTLPARYPEWGMAGACLLARIVLGEAAALARDLETKTLGDTAELVAMLAPLLPHVPETVLRVRLDFATVSIVCGLTATAYLSAVAPVNPPAIPPSAQASLLLDYVTAGLAAPVRTDATPNDR